MTKPIAEVLPMVPRTVSSGEPFVAIVSWTAPYDCVVQVVAVHGRFREWHYLDGVVVGPTGLMHTTGSDAQWSNGLRARGQTVTERKLLSAVVKGLKLRSGELLSLFLHVRGEDAEGTCWITAARTESA